jgi:hypothetical protein
MEIFSYVVTHDTGFAPNPFGGFLTLATCKPRIRARAGKGDILVGAGSASTVGNQRLVYAAEIADVIPIEEYGALPKYAVKQPSTRGQWWRKHGDNIYFSVDGEWAQRRNAHHLKRDMPRDLSGKNVLVCKRFWYFGDAAIEMPPEFNEVIKRGPGHKKIKDESLARRFVEWLRKLPTGRHGTPEMSQRQPITCTGA